MHAVVMATQDAAMLPLEAHVAPAPDEHAVSVAADGRFAALPGFRIPVDSTQAETPALFAETIDLAPTYTGLVAGTINGTAYWPVWYGNGKPVDGVNCLVNGNWHRHALISIYSNGAARLPGRHRPRLCRVLSRI
jgi:hypothetical protein